MKLRQITAFAIPITFILTMLAFPTNIDIFLAMLLITFTFYSILWIWMLVDVILRPFKDDMTKILLVLLVLIFGFPGAIVYFYAFGIQPLVLKSAHESGKTVSSKKPSAKTKSKTKSKTKNKKLKQKSKMKVSAKKKTSKKQSNRKNSAKNKGKSKKKKTSRSRKQS